MHGIPKRKLKEVKDFEESTTTEPTPVKGIKCHQQS